MTGPVVVIGVGNPWRHDDGAGLEVVRRAGPRLPPGVLVRELDGEPARIVEAWDGASLAVLVDAVRTGAAAGTLHRVLEAVGEEPPTGSPVGPTAAESSHGLGATVAHGLGQALDRLPDQLVVLGIEAADLTSGVGLSPAVAAAVPEAVEEVVAIATDGHRVGST